MDKNDYKKFKQKLTSLKLTKSDKLKYELDGLKKHLEKVENDFNKYKIHVQCEMEDKPRTQLKSMKKDIEDITLKNDALINFIFENGLGRKYYNTFVEEFYPYDCLNFNGKNEINFSNIAISDKGRNELSYRVQFEVDKLINRN